MVHARPLLSHDASGASESSALTSFSPRPCGNRVGGFGVRQIAIAMGFHHEFSPEDQTRLFERHEYRFQILRLLYDNEISSTCSETVNGDTHVSQAPESNNSCIKNETISNMESLAKEFSVGASLFWILLQYSTAMERQSF